MDATQSSSVSTASGKGEVESPLRVECAWGGLGTPACRTGRDSPVASRHAANHLLTIYLILLTSYHPMHLLCQSAISVL
jgi:hypothetical protein